MFTRYSAAIVDFTELVTLFLQTTTDRRQQLYLGTDQYGFRKGRSTRDAIAALRALHASNMD